MSRNIRPLPEFVQFKREMEAAGEAVAVSDDGIPFVHTATPEYHAGLTTVATEHFPENFDGGFTRCLYPVARDEVLFQEADLLHR